MVTDQYQPIWLVAMVTDQYQPIWLVAMHAVIVTYWSATSSLWIEEEGIRWGVHLYCIAHTWLPFLPYTPHSHCNPVEHTHDILYSTIGTYMYTSHYS